MNASDRTFSAPIGSDDLLYALRILFRKDVSVMHFEELDYISI